MRSLVYMALALLASCSATLDSESGTDTDPATDTDTAGNPYAEAVVARGPLVYYRFEETTGTPAADASGQAKAGTYADVRNGDPSARARLGRAAGFDPTMPSSVAVPALGSLTQITIECWLQPVTIDTTGDYNVIFNVDDFATGAVHFQLETYEPDKVEFSVNNGGDDDRFGVRKVQLGSWFYLVVTYDSSTGKVLFYVDGSLVATGAFSSPTSPMTLTAGHIGAWNGTTRPFDGSIDEFAIYGDVLTGPEIAAHFAAAGP